MAREHQGNFSVDSQLISDTKYVFLCLKAMAVLGNASQYCGKAIYVVMNIIWAVSIF